MKNIKMIVIDLDNTLLHTDKSISDYTIDIFEKCRAKDIRIVYATARSQKSSERFINIISPDAVISNGGALARFGENIVYSCVIPQTTADELIKSYAGLSDIGYITVETSNNDYFVNYPIDMNHKGWVDYYHAVPKDFSKGIDDDVYKITLEADNKASVFGVAAKYPQVSIMSFAGENWYRLAHTDADKWVAIRHLAEYLKISNSDIVSFGDDYNDIEMIKECGIGVAVANAIDEVKAAADYICDTNDNDGVAKWLEENIIKLK